MGRLASKGSTLDTSFDFPIAACRDPLNPNSGWWLCDKPRIRYFDEMKDVVTVVAGARRDGTRSVDGIGLGARFFELTSLLPTSDGKTLLCAETTAIRRMDTTSHAVSTPQNLPLAAYSNARSMVWDRAPATDPDTAFYCICDPDRHRNVIARIDLATNQQTLYPLTHSPIQLVVTGTGHIIFTSEDAGSVYALDPHTKTLSEIHWWPSRAVQWIALTDSDRSIVVATTKAIERWSLSPEYLTPPQCTCPDCVDR